MEVIDTIPDDVKDGYLELRTLPDGRVIGVRSLLFHWTLEVDIDWGGYAERYCYKTPEQALIGLREWTGVDDPPGGWYRHPTTGRRRPDGDPSREYINA